MAYGQPNRTAAGAQTDAAALDAGLRSYMLGIYNYMGLGLALSAIVALAVVAVPALTSVVVFSPLRLLFVLAPLGIILLMSFRAQTMSAGTIKVLYWTLCATMGASMSALLIIYEPTSVVKTFFITAAAFGALSLYGYTTKRSLSGVGSFAIMGLIGIILASIVNIFLASSMLGFIISVAGVLIFSALIAFDTQRLKESYYDGMNADDQTKLSVFGAMSLYINFVNLFQFLLMFLGDRE
ncbi:MAG: Bax inhibitor-1/YccA family protein [Pseudomonadota bacterium]